jgi:carbon-monoxide dehydrogenase large subunit
VNKPSEIKEKLSPVTSEQRYIGMSEPRHGAKRLTEGNGKYIDDMSLPKMAHVVYWRSPVAHMKILKIYILFIVFVCIIASIIELIHRNKI